MREDFQKADPQSLPFVFYMSKALIITLIICLIGNVSWGADLLPQFGVRPAGLAGAYVALADDANSVLWNPAGLAQNRRSSLTLGQNRLSFDTRDYLAIFVFHPSQRHFSAGIAWTQASQDNVADYKIVTDSMGNPVIDPLTNLPQHQILNYYTRFSHQALASLGLSLGDHFDVGASLRGTFINQAPTMANSLSGDFGGLIHSGNISLGFCTPVSCGT